ncbi:M23 family metallopeptidase [Heliorestis acidaminivorans]|uniref:M23 family metallopeptidase n=1 Tax=Heliorestis acidaminivorans TaxID=553427 RepID=A0A6I0F041_9FIRM|nr:M23 family metallopeptidase [Heliorestis acidaminivorans]KAB2952332.1 M23 family metallopeptidase [Heliorestis acidaminivorans]
MKKKPESEKWIYNHRRQTPKSKVQQEEKLEEKKNSFPQSTLASTNSTNESSKESNKEGSKDNQKELSKSEVQETWFPKKTRTSPLNATDKPRWALYDPPAEKENPKMSWRWFGQSVMALILLAFFWGVFQIEHPWAKVAQQQVERLVTEDMEFEPMRQAVLRLGLWTDATVTAPVFAPAGGVARYGLPVEEPVKGIVVEAFGQRGTDFYPGVRIVGTVGAPVVAGVEGTLITHWPEDGGTYVQIAMNDGSIRIMGPLQELYVQTGELVQASTVIGPLGRSASAGQAQLYIEMRQGGRSVDPLAPPVEKGGAVNENSPVGGGGDSSQ